MLRVRNVEEITLINSYFKSIAKGINTVLIGYYDYLGTNQKDIIVIII